MKIDPVKIRELMIKDPRSRLWNKPLSKWVFLDVQEFNAIDNGTHNQKAKRKTRSGNAIKVIRVSDGLIYDSIEDCRRKNGYHKMEMVHFLNLGVSYKKLPLNATV